MRQLFCVSYIVFWLLVICTAGCAGPSAWRAVPVEPIRILSSDAVDSTDADSYQFDVALQVNWAAGDLNYDGVVDSDDLAIWQAIYAHRGTTTYSARVRVMQGCTPVRDKLPSVLMSNGTWYFGDRSNADGYAFIRIPAGFQETDVSDVRVFEWTEVE